MIPNLDYIDEISDNDLTFKNKIIGIIKRDFPLEKDEFFKNYKSNMHLLAAENVHKLKHKINMLGLEKGYDIAVKFENELREKNNQSFESFIDILKTIDNYLKNI
jgi:HPt (histidine-containing phosphotransfer) domain-containing protein